MNRGANTPIFDFRDRLVSEYASFSWSIVRIAASDIRAKVDSSDVIGIDYPTKTFCVFKNPGMSEFGEYRPRRLMLEAWDREEVGG